MYDYGEQIARFVTELPHGQIFETEQVARSVADTCNIPLQHAKSVTYNQLKRMTDASHIGDNLVTMTLEIDQDVYNQASKACKKLGTTIEIMTESFFKFCVIPENLPLLKAFLGKEKAPAEAGAKEDINRMVLEQVYAIAIKQGI